MAKKGAGIRLWFRKLSIKRFHVSAQRKRRSSPHHLHGLSSSAPNLHGLISSPYHTLNSHSTHSSPHQSPPAITSFSSSSSPQNPLSAFSSSPWRQSCPPISPLSHTSPCTSPTPVRCSGPGALQKSQCQPTYTATAVLLSPINRKAMDIPYPAPGESSPATFLQSPIFQAAPVVSPAKIFSPPLSSAHSHRILFRSPLHPLAHQIQQAIPRNGAKSKATRSLDGSSRETKFSVKYSQKVETSVSASRKSDASAGYSQAQYREVANTKESAQPSRAQGRSIRVSSTKQSPLVVDCGCRPNLSSSFRKTKKTLQACGSCSSSNHGVISAHDRCYEQAMLKIKGLQSGASAEESRTSALTSAAFNSCQEEACILFPKQGLHSHEVLSHKTLQQLRKRKKKSLLSAANASPKEISNVQKFVYTSPPLSVECKGTGKASSLKVSGPLKDAALIVPDAHTLAWEKEFSSFTSEDTFFSSFERSRPSFSSNSSSECFDKKLRRTNLALSSATMVSNAAGTPSKRMNGDLGSNVCNPHRYNPATNKANIACQGANSKPGDPFIARSFHEGHANEDKKELAASKHAMAPSCGAVSSEPPMCGMKAKPGVKRGCVNPLVGIKEASCEEGNTSTTEQCNLSREGYMGLLNMQKKSSSSPEYAFSSHSDYYASVRGRPTKNIRARKKSNEANVAQGAGVDTGSARIRRRAQLQAKWMLREERIQWQSSMDESEVDGADDGNAHKDNATNGLCDTPTSRQRSVEIERNFSGSKEAAGVLNRNSAQTMLLASNNSKPDCDIEKEDKSITLQVNVDTQSSSAAKKSRLIDSVAVVKSSRDPLVDFRDSMVDMILERQIYTAEDLGELLRCFLSLNPSEHHDTIVRAFMEVWARIFQGS